MQKIGNSSLVAEPGVGDNTTSNMDQDTDILDFFFGHFVLLECDKGDTVMEKNGSKQFSFSGMVFNRFAVRV